MRLCGTRVCYMLEAERELRESNAGGGLRSDLFEAVGWRQHVR